MTPEGWIIMFISVGTVTTLFVWSISKVLRTPVDHSEKMHGFEMETPDELTGKDPETGPEG